MASGTLDADKISKEKCKWGQFNKFYTRRNKRGGNKEAAVVDGEERLQKEQSLVDLSSFSPGRSPVAAENAAENGTEDAAENGTVNAAENGVVRPIVTVVDDRSLVDLSSGSAGRSPVATENAAENGTEDAVVNSTENGTVDAAENGTKTALENGVVRPIATGVDDHGTENAAENGVVRPIATVVDDRVRICLEGSTPKDEIKELREKLKLELEEVRSLVRKLEDKEAELTHYSNMLATADDAENVEIVDIDESYDQVQGLQYPGNNVAGAAENGERYDQLQGVEYPGNNVLGATENGQSYDQIQALQYPRNNVLGAMENSESYDQIQALQYQGNNVLGAADNGVSYDQLHASQYQGNNHVLGAADNGESYDHLRALQYQGNGVVDRRSLLRVNSEMGTDYMDRRALTRVYSDIGSDMVDRRALTRVGPFENHNLSRFSQLSVSVGEYVEKEKRTPKANQYYRNSEFLLQKDRLPPESNKKQKSNGGRKSDYSASLERHKNQLFKSCSSLLQRLMKHKFGWVFNEPVNAKLLGLHDYNDIIKHPMDLGTVKSYLAQKVYKTPGEFAEDVRLTFRNAMTYNPKGQDVHLMAEVLLEIFEGRWEGIESDWRYGAPVREVPIARNGHSFRTLDRSQSMGLPLMPRPKPPSFAPVTRTPVPKKPKAKDLNKRNMTYEEKQKLSANLQSLPSEKLDSIVQIINKSNTSLAQNDDEIEVDIDSVDAETLWELDRFVSNYKKNLSKVRRRAEQAEQARALAGNANQVMVQNPAAPIPDAPQEKRADEQNLAASLPNQAGDNVSSSSSSSSDSSSDSDSDSSSDSDAGQ